MTMRILFAAVVALSAVSLAMASPVDDFWNSLSELCGQAFEGQVVQEPEGESDFEGQRLVMHVRDCSDSRIRIPFVVGDDLSRRSEEHTSELQSRGHLVCRLLLEKKK